MKVRKVGHKLLWESRQRPGLVTVKCFEFEKVKQFLDREGEVVSEIPFSETVYLISKFAPYNARESVSLWLSEREFDWLCDTLDKAAEKSEDALLGGASSDGGD